MTATTTRRAARPATARAATRPARNTAAAVTSPLHDIARTTAAPVVVSLDGAAEACGVASLATADARRDFAETVIVSLIALAGGSNATVRGIETVAPGAYLADMIVDGAPFAVAFGHADAPAPVAPLTLPPPVSAEPAPAPTPAPRRPVTPQIAPLAGMTPLGLSPTAEARAAEPKALPSPQMCLDLKTASADARAAAATVETVRITLEADGSVDVQATVADLADRTRFAREVVGPIVARFREWPRITIDTVNATGRLAYRAAYSNGAARQVATWLVVPAGATLTMPLPARKGAGLARGVDALAAAMGLKPAGHHVATAEAKAKAAGIKLSRTDRAAAEALDAAGRRVEAGAVKADAAPRMSAANRAVFDAAEAGTLPTPPNFSAETHTRYRPKLAALVALVAAGDVAGLEAYPINPISTSPKALNKYRNAAVIALRAIAAKAGKPA